MSVKAELMGKPQVKLVIDYDYAVTLKALTGNVCGGEKPNYSRHTDAIYDALDNLGVESETRVKSPEGIYLK